LRPHDLNENGAGKRQDNSRRRACAWRVLQDLVRSLSRGANKHSGYPPDKLSPAMLDKIADHLIPKALGNNSAVVAEARRRIETGEQVTVEAMNQYAAERPGVPEDLHGQSPNHGRPGVMSTRVVLERGNIVRLTPFERMLRGASKVVADSSHT
jgi:hypothetical protein